MPDSLKTERETILVVDDNDILRRFVITLLERSGFNVISADSGPNAIRVAEKTEGKIDLLLTDWDMPEMSGIALGQALKAARPDLRIMQMSGGEHETLLVLNYGWAFLQKPFVAPKLLQMITDVLNSPDRAQPGGESFDTRIDTGTHSAKLEDPDRHPADSDESPDTGKHAA